MKKQQVLRKEGCAARTVKTLVAFGALLAGRLNKDGVALAQYAGLALEIEGDETQDSEDQSRAERSDRNSIIESQLSTNYSVKID